MSFFFYHFAFEVRILYLGHNNRDRILTMGMNSFFCFEPVCRVTEGFVRYSVLIGGGENLLSSQKRSIFGIA